MAWVEILPGFESLFPEKRWESAASYLSWTGILVNRHRSRQVEQVFLPGPDQGSISFFLKKEFSVSWRDRLRNAWHGFGWCATAIREGATLQALRRAGIGCPDVVALGEDGKHALLLTRADEAIDMREVLPNLNSNQRSKLAEALGRELAKVHNAGFDHPDLYAKHILVAPAQMGFRFCILDWQRSRHRRRVSWGIRCRDLACLDATLHEALATDRLRFRLLRAYCKAACLPTSPLGRVARQIRALVLQLRARRNIREFRQLAIRSEDQQFVTAHEGQTLVVRSLVDDSSGTFPAWLTGNVPTPSDVSQSTFPRTSDELPLLAHTLFRLHRFGICAPRLLAVAFLPTQIVVYTRSPQLVPWDAAYAKSSPAARGRLLREAGQLVRQVHEAGYRLPPGQSWARRLGVDASGHVVLARVEPLLEKGASWQEAAPLELAHQDVRLSRPEWFRFLQGYLQDSRVAESLG